MKIGYIRVSTQEQHIERQVDALDKEGCERVFIDKMSGSRADRPELQRLFDVVRPGDVVIINELSRLGRSVKDLIAIVERLNAAQVQLKSLAEPYIDTTTPGGQLVFTIFAAMAEFQRKIIVENTAAGLKAARARGRIGGRPQIDEEKIATALALDETGKYTVNQILKMTDLSRATFYKYRKERAKE